MLRSQASPLRFINNYLKYFRCRFQRMKFVMCLVWNIVTCSNVSWTAARQFDKQWINLFFCALLVSASSNTSQKLISNIGLLAFEFFSNKFSRSFQIATSYQNVSSGWISCFQLKLLQTNISFSSIFCIHLILFAFSSNLIRVYQINFSLPVNFCKDTWGCYLAMAPMVPHFITSWWKSSLSDGKKFAFTSLETLSMGLFCPAL